MTAEGPGTGKIEIFSSIHLLINILPGSEIVGVPASEIIDIILFSLNNPNNLIKFFFSLNL